MGLTIIFSTICLVSSSRSDSFEFSGSILVVSISGWPFITHFHHSILFTFCSSTIMELPSFSQTWIMSKYENSPQQRTNLPETFLWFDLLMEQALNIDTLTREQENIFNLPQLKAFLAILSQSPIAWGLFYNSHLCHAFLEARGCATLLLTRFDSKCTLTCS